MKKYLALLFLILFATLATAQTQQGIVKTRGRVVNGQVVAGQRLTGATITLSVGNPQVSQAQGAFSFNVPSGKSFSLVSAKKQGYTLADPEYTRRTFKYSAGNPFYVVLEDEAQRQADIKEATDKVRKTLKRELRKREDELDELRESNAITQTKYDSLRIEFANYRQSSESLVNEMAERFAAIDYDQLDEFNRQVQQYIEEGELLKADSLINTRGSLEERYARVKEQESVNTQREEEIRQQQETLAKSQELTQREKDDLMSDLYAKHTIYLQAYQQDSALNCLKMRADLDTMNVEAVWDYAVLCHNQKKFTDCEEYYQICLRLCICNNDSSKLANIQNCLGSLYMNLHDKTERAEMYLKMSLANYELLFKNNPIIYRADYANILNSFGNYFLDMGDYDNSEKYYMLALDHRKQLFENNPQLYRECLSSTLNNLGVLYRNRNEYSKGMEYLKLALEHREQLFASNPSSYREDLSTTLYNLGIQYKIIDDYKNSEIFLKEALKHRTKLFLRNHDAYRPILATSQNALGELYLRYDSESSERYLTLAQEHREHLCKMNPDAYCADLATTTLNLMHLYESINNIEQYDIYLEKALELFHVLYISKSKKYSNEIIGLQNRKAMRLMEKGEVDDALNLVQNTFAMDQSKEKTKQVLVNCYKTKAYMFIDQLNNAIQIMDNAISSYPDIPEFYDTKGEILLLLGRNDEALEMWYKVLELDPNVLDNYPDGTNLSNGLKKLGLIE